MLMNITIQVRKDLDIRTDIFTALRYYTNNTITKADLHTCSIDYWFY